MDQAIVREGLAHYGGLNMRLGRGVDAWASEADDEPEIEQEN
jgi:hypothetical protein